MDDPIAAAPAIRYEGDTTIYPLIEERLILTKQLILKEELRVTKRDTERLDTQTVTLLREHLTAAAAFCGVKDSFMDIPFCGEHYRLNQVVQPVRLFTGATSLVAILPCA